MRTKLFLSAFIGLLCIGTAFAQMDGKGKKASPAATMKAEIDGTTITINYSQPAVKGREIYGDLVPFDKIWRTGANEATTISFSADTYFGGKKVKTGTYSLFTIPGEKEWTIILNSEAKQWGAYSYKVENDVLRVKVKSEAAEMTERMTFMHMDSSIYLVWDKTSVPIKIGK